MKKAYSFIREKTRAGFFLVRAGVTYLIIVLFYRRELRFLLGETILALFISAVCDKTEDKKGEAK